MYEHSLLEERDMRLSTGGVEIPVSETDDKRSSKFKWSSYFESNRVHTFFDDAGILKRYIIIRQRKVARY